MNEYRTSERVTRLRARAIQDSLVHPLPFLEGRTEYRRDDRYGWDDRQLMLFYEAWEREYAGRRRFCAGLRQTQLQREILSRTCHEV